VVVGVIAEGRVAGEGKTEAAEDVAVAEGEEVTGGITTRTEEGGGEGEGDGVEVIGRTTVAVATVEEIGRTDVVVVEEGEADGTTAGTVVEGGEVFGKVAVEMGGEAAEVVGGATKALGADCSIGDGLHSKLTHILSQTIITPLFTTAARVNLFGLALVQM